MTGSPTTDRNDALVCNCADKPPTIPTYREPHDHWRSCPMFAYGLVLRMQANNEEQRKRSTCPLPRMVHGRRLPDVEAAILGAEALTLAALRAALEGVPIGPEARLASGTGESA